MATTLRAEDAIKEWDRLFTDKEGTSAGKIPLTARQSLAEAQENKVKQTTKNSLESRILEQLNREFNNLKDNTDSLTVGDRLAVLKQLIVLVKELN